MNFSRFHIHSTNASHIAVHTKLIVGGKSAILILFNFETIAFVSSLNGDHTKGIPEKFINETLYQDRFETRLIIESFAASNLAGLISFALIDKETSNRI
ncbi:MAG: hypothetical protein ACOZBL_05590 [Patescibacteria group bacterium]